MSHRMEGVILLSQMYNYTNTVLGVLSHSVRGGGLVVSVLDSGLRGPGSSPGQVTVFCSWARHFTLTVHLSTQEYKLSGKPDEMLGG